MDKEKHNIIVSGFPAEGNQPELSKEAFDREPDFEKPERRLYEDAEFVPQGDSADIPQHYVPSEKKPKAEKDVKARRLFVKTLCLCLACAVLGGLAGAAVTSLINRNSNNANVSTGIPIVSEGQTVSGKSSNANDVYALGCQQVVAITVSVNGSHYIGQPNSVTASGSGFVVTTDGYILTNYHVIEYACESKSAISVVFKDGSVYEASVVGIEAESDLAVLKIDAVNLTPATIGDSSRIQVGDTVYAIGNPLGEFDFSMTTGSVSALDRGLSLESGMAAINMFQFDAAVNSGNSGGPVYNTSGQVIGIVTAKSAVDGTEGLGFAIPINDAVDIANELITNGYVSGKAYMGVNIDARYTSVYADYYGMPEGAYVFSVEQGGCAEKAGITAGDIITEVDGNEIKSYSDLNSAIRNFKAGDTVEIVVYRANDYITLKITFDESKPDAEYEGVNESGLSVYPHG